MNRHWRLFFMLSLGGLIMGGFALFMLVVDDDPAAARDLSRYALILGGAPGFLCLACLLNRMHCTELGPERCTFDVSWFFGRTKRIQGRPVEVIYASRTMTSSFPMRQPGRCFTVAIRFEDGRTVEVATPAVEGDAFEVLKERLPAALGGVPFTNDRSL